MSVLTRWLGGKRPGLRSTWPVHGLAAVELRKPLVIVATITDNDVRRVGLCFEQGGVSVEVGLAARQRFARAHVAYYGPGSAWANNRAARRGWPQ